MIYVLEGTATLVTGGSIVDDKITEPGQIRGPAIQGGETRHLKPGDVIVVPPHTPHQFVETSNPFLYQHDQPVVGSACWRWWRNSAGRSPPRSSGSIWHT